MKIMLSVAVAAVLLVALPTMLHGAPQVTSEELGRAVEVVQEMLASEINKARSAQYPWELISNAQYWPHKESKATAQVRGFDVRNCGQTSNDINSILSTLTILFSDNDIGILVDCKEKENCARVRVDVPADDRKAEVRVCERGGGQVCVEVLTQSSQKCPGYPFEIPIIIPLPSGKDINIMITFADPYIPHDGDTTCTNIRVDSRHVQC